MLRRMPRLVIRIALVGVITSTLACAEDPELSQLEAIRKEVCACTTAACGEAAMKKLPSVSHTAGKPATQREELAARKIVDCLAKLYEPIPSPTEAPDPDPPAGP